MSTNSIVYRELFDASAASYDRVNRLISLGLDARWRRWAAKEATSGLGAPRVLDAFSGTGLVGIEAARMGARVTLADASPQMLRHAEKVAHRRGVEIDLVQTDLNSGGGHISGEPFDAMTVVFGLRYVADPASVLRELARHVAPGGRVVTVEFCVARQGMVSTPATTYFFSVLPRIAAAAAGDRLLYDTLIATTRAFGGPDRLAEVNRQAGLEVVQRHSMGFGLVIGVVGQVPTSDSGGEVTRMDMQMMQQVVEWIQQNVGDRTSKQELMQKAQGSNLPGEAKSAFQDLPEGEHSKNDVISLMKEKAMSQVGGGKSGQGMGGMGGMFGG